MARNEQLLQVFLRIVLYIRHNRCTVVAGEGRAVRLKEETSCGVVFSR